MPVVSVVYASRHGATRGIAERISEVLRAEGLEATVASADAPLDPAAEAFVIGSAVYVGSWLKEAKAFVEHHAVQLRQRPVWLFSSGPLAPAAPGTEGREAVNPAVVQELSDLARPRDHGVFAGAFDPSDPPKAISERVIRALPAMQDILVPGDFRDWPAIEAWAHGIAASLRPAATVRPAAPVAAAGGPTM
jgi:menaquinone-dependent protoporphyrinogen oxidase